MCVCVRARVTHTHTHTHTMLSLPSIEYVLALPFANYESTLYLIVDCARHSLTHKPKIYNPVNARRVLNRNRLFTSITLYKIIFNYAVSCDAIITRVSQTIDRGETYVDCNGIFSIHVNTLWKHGCWANWINGRKEHVPHESVLASDFFTLREI